MTGLPFHCPHCGLVFVSNAFQFEEARNVTIRNLGTNCPRCNQAARSIDGEFDFVGNAIAVRSATPRTLAILGVLQAALHDAQQGKPETEVIEKIKEASPQLAKAIEKKVSSSGKPILATLLFALLASCSMNTTLDWNQLVDQVHVYATGSEPYPKSEPAEARQSGPAEKPNMNRQQRRYKERQTKKQQRQSERQLPKKPRH